MPTSITWVAPATTTKFTANVALRIERGATTSAAVTEANESIPKAMAATCSKECTVGELLAAVLQGIQDTLGSPAGTLTATEWVPRIAVLLKGCPYETKFEETVRQAFADGKTVTLERTNVKGRNKKLVLICTRPTGGATKNTAEWTEPSDVVVKIEKAVAMDGEDEDRLDAEPETQIGDFKLSTFDVHGTIKQPRNIVRTARSCMAPPKACSIQ